MPSDSEKETILKYTQFMVPSKGNVYQQVWFCVLTNKRLIFYSLKGGGSGSFSGAIIGAGIGLVIGLIISIINVFFQTNHNFHSEDYGITLNEPFISVITNLAKFGLPLAVIGMVIGIKKGSFGASKGEQKPNAENLELFLQNSPEHYEFPRPTLPNYKERSPFMGGITLNLGKHRQFSFAHEPGYSEIKSILELAKKEEGDSDIPTFGK